MLSLKNDRWNGHCQDNFIYTYEYSSRINKASTGFFMKYDLRNLSLALSEAFESWRVIPVTLVIAYVALVAKLSMWFMSIPTYVQERCDPAVLQIFLDNKYSIADAQRLSCTAIDVIGGPTGNQTAFVSTIVGLSVGIFALYIQTSRYFSSRNAIPTPEPAAPVIPQVEAIVVDTSQNVQPPEFNGPVAP